MQTKKLAHVDPDAAARLAWRITWKRFQIECARAQLLGEDRPATPVPEHGSLRCGARRAGGQFCEQQEVGGPFARCRHHEGYGPDREGTHEDLNMYDVITGHAIYPKARLEKWAGELSPLIPWQTLKKRRSPLWFAGPPSAAEGTDQISTIPGGPG